MKCRYCGKTFTRCKIVTHKAEQCQSRPFKPSPVKLSRDLSLNNSCSLVSCMSNANPLVDFSGLVTAEEDALNTSASSAVSDTEDDLTHGEDTDLSCKSIGEEEEEENIADLVDTLEMETDKAESNFKYWSSFVMSMAIFLVIWQLLNYLSHAALERLLYGFGHFFQLAAQHHPALLTLSSLFPVTIYQLRQKLGLSNDTFVRFAVCPNKKCHRIFPLTEIPTSQICSCRHKLGSKSRKRNGEVIFKPTYTYSVKPLERALQDFFMRPNIETLCKTWKTRVSPDDSVLFDVYDGLVWKENSELLAQDNTYAFLGNLDWFQPFERSQVSVGVFYVVCLNLPCHLRFKLENVLVLAVIPWMGHEPNNLNEFMHPIVTDFLSFYRGRQMNTSDHPSGILTKALLLGTCSDLPATRKLNGFLSYNATKGCSKCTIRLPNRQSCSSIRDYGTPFRAVNPQEIANQTVHSRQLPWITRMVGTHRTIVEKLLVSEKKEKQNIQQKTGYKETELLKLPYFDTVRFHLIDPMHCLFEGVAKTVFAVWMKNGILSQDACIRLDDRLKALHVPAEFERPPKQMSSIYGLLKAVNWKDFTLYYSLYVLPGLLPAQCWSYWREFALACRHITKKEVSYSDLQLFMEHYVAFVKGFIQKHGVDAVTPNMHLLMHFDRCVLDYGPVYKFWCFPFERYNGILGKYPTNGHTDIDSQLLRRFSLFSSVSSLKYTLPDDFRNVVCSALPSSQQNQSSQAESCQFYAFLQQQFIRENDCTRLFQQNLPIELPSKMRKHAYQTLSLRNLLQVYRRMFPTRMLDLDHLGKYVKVVKRIKLGNRTFTSNSDPVSEKHQSVVIAKWFPSADSQELKVRVGSVLKFIVHEVCVDSINTITTVFAVMKWYSEDCRFDSELYQSPVLVANLEDYSDVGFERFLPIQLIYAQCVCGIDFTCKKWLVCIPSVLNSE